MSPYDLNDVSRYNMPRAVHLPPALSNAEPPLQVLRGLEGDHRTAEQMSEFAAS